VQEILPGLFHWTTFHDGIAARVSSYYLEPAGALIDPRVPDEGLDAFAGRDRPQQVVLTSGLHARHAERFAESFGCVIRASPEALERLEGSLYAQRYSEGDEIAPGIVAIHIGKLCPDEYALPSPSRRALSPSPMGWSATARHWASSRTRSSARTRMRSKRVSRMPFVAS